jgi:hypothetical protein
MKTSAGIFNEDIGRTLTAALVAGSFEAQAILSFSAKPDLTPTIPDPVEPVQLFMIIRLAWITNFEVQKLSQQIWCA